MASDEAAMEMTQIRISIVLFIASGILAFAILFIFVKRQISRYTLRNKKGPHIAIGQDAPNVMRAEMERLLQRTCNILYEPRLLSSPHSTPTADVWRMKTVDDLKELEAALVEVGVAGKRAAQSSVRAYLTACRCSVFSGDHVGALLDDYIQHYHTARYATKDYTERDYGESSELLGQLLTCVSSYKPGGGARLPSPLYNQPTAAATVVYRQAASPPTHMHRLDGEVNSIDHV